jgi:23S rRNA pseudouridine1911/1915/1917 synthase
MPTHTLTVRKAARLDKALAALLPDLSRSAAQRLIDQSLVMVNGQVRAASHNVQPGDVLVVTVPAATPATAQPEAIPLDILYEDNEVIAVNKPAGMVVHPGAGNPGGTLANAILAHAPSIAQVGDAQRPGIVHRLDKETSGIVLLAKTPAAYLALQGQFKARTVKKLYLALCVGEVQPPRGVIHKPIARDPAYRQRMAVVAAGRDALTQYALGEVFRVTASRMIMLTVQEGDAKEVTLSKGALYSYVRVRPATGRTHQIRVHLASIGFPIVGDALYGATKRDTLSRALAPRQLLHASELNFESPASGQAVHLYAPLPVDMRRVIDLLGE